MIKGESQKRAAQEFYRDALKSFGEAKLNFLIGGAFALKQHTGIYRDTKDLDLFCKAGEYPRILKHAASLGFKTEITDARWVAKAFKDEHFIDFIFNTANNLCPVDDTWFANSVKGELFGVPAVFMGAEELFWCKLYVQNRDHYDGADLNHLILKKGKEMDWNRIMSRMEQHWHLLLAQFLNFQFVYPSERDMVPRQLFGELLEKARDQYELPLPMERVCRGPLIEHTEYNTDISNWEYKIITFKRY